MNAAAAARPFPLGQYELPLRSAWLGKSEAVLWVLAATPDDSRQIVEAIRHFEEGNLSSFFVSVFDGAPAFGANDILAIHTSGTLQLFAARLPAIPSRLELAEEIAAALADAKNVHPFRQKAGEFLFVRLFNSIRDERPIHADSSLARALTFLQASHAAAPRLVTQMADNILAAIPNFSSAALDGLIRRLKAHALFEVHKSLGDVELIVASRELYLDAATSFEIAGIPAQARACQRSARTLEQLVLYGRTPEPMLPSLEPTAEDATRIHLSRPHFRAFRALAVPLSVRLPIELRSEQPMVASKLRPIGMISLPEKALMSAMRHVESTNLVPNLRVVVDSPMVPLSKRVQVSIEREHFSLLGLEDRPACEGERSFGVIINARDWEVSIERGTARLGRPVEFSARALSRAASPLTILVTAGASYGKFEVHA